MLFIETIGMHRRNDGPRDRSRSPRRDRDRRRDGSRDRYRERTRDDEMRDRRPSRREDSREKPPAREPVREPRSSSKELDRTAQNKLIKDVSLSPEVVSQSAPAELNANEDSGSDIELDDPNEIVHVIDPTETTGQTIDDQEDPELAMLKLMGFEGFETTKGKHVPGADASGALIVGKRKKYKQYMHTKKAESVARRR